MSTDNTHYGLIPDYLLNPLQSNCSVYQVLTPSTRCIQLHLPVLLAPMTAQLRRIARHLIEPHLNELRHSLLYTSNNESELFKAYSFILQHLNKIRYQPHELMDLWYLIQVAFVLYHPCYRNLPSTSTSSTRPGDNAVAKLLQMCTKIDPDLMAACHSLIHYVYYPSVLSSAIRHNAQIISYVTGPVEIERKVRTGSLQMKLKPLYTASLLTDLLNLMNQAQLLDSIELSNLVTRFNVNENVNLVLELCSEKLMHPLLSLSVLAEGNDEDRCTADEIAEHLPAAFTIHSLRVSAPEMNAIVRTLS